MKDEKGHGSDAHSSGVQAVGKPQTLHWEKIHGGHVLLPESGSYPALASVGKYAGSSYATAATTKGYQAQVHQDFAGSPNGRNGNWSVHGSVQGAKKWAEGAVTGGWDPPSIRK